MNTQRFGLTSAGFNLLLVIILSGCNLQVTSTPSQNMPTLAVLPTLTSSPTASQQPESTASMIIATATEQTLPTETQTMIPSNTPVICTPPNGQVRWVIYIVQAHNTLFSLARSTNTTVEQIQHANCLNGTIIYVGQPLYLPFIPVSPPTINNPPPNNPAPTSTIITPTAPPPGDPRTEVDPGSGTAGSTFVIKIRDFEPLATITIKIEPIGGSPFSSFNITMDADGDFDVAWVSPNNLTPGPYIVRSFRADGSQGKVGTILIVP